jgi:hercynine metabolism protein
MSPAADWLEQLEARLEQQLESFLRANPAQEALLQEQERLERKQRQKQLLLQAEALRSELLQIAAEVRQWRDRSDRARQAGATDLATRADRQVAQLMERGRLRWQALEQLGREVRNNTAAQAAPQPTAAATTNPGSPANDPLEQAWARFELEQELEALRRQQRSR